MKYPPEKIRERIEAIMKAENLSQAAFAEKIGITRSNLHHVLSGRNQKPGTDLILRILEEFPNINTDWLLKGEGRMYKTSKDTEPDLFTTPQQSKKEESNQQKQEKKSQITTQKHQENKTDKQSEEQTNDNNSNQNKVEQSQFSPLQIIVLYPDKTFDLFKKR